MDRFLPSEWNFLISGLHSYLTWGQSFQYLDNLAHITNVRTLLFAHDGCFQFLLNAFIIFFRRPTGFSSHYFYSIVRSRAVFFTENRWVQKLKLGDGICFNHPHCMLSIHINTCQHKHQSIWESAFHKASGICHACWISCSLLFILLLFWKSPSELKWYKQASFVLFKKVEKVSKRCWGKILTFWAFISAILWGRERTKNYHLSN